MLDRGSSSKPEARTPTEILDRACANSGLVEISGVVKWFDPSKGYGFIVPDEDGMPEVFLHSSCLRLGGIQMITEGMRVVVEIEKRQRGLKVSRIVSLDESTALYPVPRPSAPAPGSISPIGGLEQVQVKFFNRLRGFGFLIRGEGTKDIFVHMEQVRRAGLTGLQPGQLVWVRYGQGPKGLIATEIKLSPDK